MVGSVSFHWNIFWFENAIPLLTNQLTTALFCIQIKDVNPNQKNHIHIKRPTYSEQVTTIIISRTQYLAIYNSRRNN